MSNDAKRVPRHSAVVDFIQHNERRWVVLEEDHEKVVQELVRAAYEEGFGDGCRECAQCYPAQRINFRKLKDAGWSESQAEQSAEACAKPAASTCAPTASNWSMPKSGRSGHDQATD